MSKYVEKMFERFKMAVKQSILVPLQEGIVGAMHEAPVTDEQFQRDFEFREKVGCILYYMICMRPNICYAVGLMAKQANRITRAAAAGVTQLLQYCYNTRFEKLVLGGQSAHITGYSDSDWATDRINRRSQSSFLIFLGLGPVEWGSLQQGKTALSTAEAELYAKVEPCRAIVWLRNLLANTKITPLITSYASTLFGDNMAADAICSRTTISSKSKHFGIKAGFIQDLVAGGVVVQEHVDTRLNVADLGTKVTSKRVFLELTDLAMGRGIILQPSKKVKTTMTDELV
jgi:hypothetical protein